MQFISITGSFFELNIEGYQFPEISDADYDSDYLNIKIHGKHPQGEWTVTQPCLLTWEIVDLVEWHEAIADNLEVDSVISFLKPNLWFMILKDIWRLRVYFELECRPQWAMTEVVGMDNFYLEFEVTEAILRQAAKDLQSQLQRFPIRVGK